MTDTEQKKAAKDFATYWAGKGYEKGDSQPFWLSLLRDVLGVEHPEQYIRFESQVKIDHTSFIDGMISATHVLIEQKGLDKSLREPILQSDGTRLKPFEQALRYSASLPYSQRPRWIVTCNFQEFLIYDMEKPTGEPESLLLKNLPKELYRLQFLVDTGNENIKREMEISIKAGELVGVLYDEILEQYHNADSPETLKSLNMLCVRLVFCLYAEDSGLFGGHSKFHDYIKAFADKDIKSVRRALIDLFKVLDTPEEKRNEIDPYMDEMLSSFPYVNGGLFADEAIEIPPFNEKIVKLLLENASEGFDWSEISPTIFGAVFESTLNPETRRSGGMHYTSIENIHKVIDPLFLDDLKDELLQIKAIKIEKTRNTKLEAFRTKLANITFLDPACGSGNFLTETYLSLRRLENEALSLALRGQITMETGGVIKVSIGQFYGIEINDFAVTVAKTALWIAESQMMKETEEIVHANLNFLPLKSYVNIIEGDALTLPWESVVPKDKLNFIMGNPPFNGGKKMNATQKREMVNVLGKIPRASSLDYVSAWYFLAAKYIQNTNIQVAFVSTNSITQGAQVFPIWNHLIYKENIHINFAHKTFKWDSESREKAAVHCVIIGFALYSKKVKYIYENNRLNVVSNINPYLIEAPNILIQNRSASICDAPKIVYGNMPNDGGKFILSKEEKETFISEYPDAQKFIKKYQGAEDYINGNTRYCLWLIDATPSEIRENKFIFERVKAVKEIRQNSTAQPTREKADTPHLFFFISQPSHSYLMIPRTSSENRKYVPIGFLPPDIIASDAASIIPDATLYHFGILTSNVHNAWLRTVGGRLKSDYRYSGGMVYNNFPWCEPTAEQKVKIEETAQAILDARSLYPESTLDDLYDEVTMPIELRNAHRRNDKAVMEAYGFWGKLNSESECVAELMKMYQNLTK